MSSALKMQAYLVNERPCSNEKLYNEPPIKKVVCQYLREVPSGSLFGPKFACEKTCTSQYVL